MMSMRSKAVLLAATQLLATAAYAAPHQPIAIPDARPHTESLTATSNGDIYAGSLLGVIYRAKPGETVAEPFIRASAANGLQATLGVWADERNGLLWACSMPSPFATQRTEGIVKVIAFDLRKGDVRATYPMPADKPGMCNDFATAADGSTYVTDTPGGRIYRIRPGAPAMELLVEDKDRLGGIDGIAFTADGAMIVNNVTKNSMQRIDRKADGSFAGITELKLDRSLQGPDGLRAIAGQRLLQGEGPGGRVTEVTIDGDRAAIRVVAEGIDGPVGVTMARGIGWAAESKIGFAMDPSKRDQDPGVFHIIPVPEVKQ